MKNLIIVLILVSLFSCNKYDQTQCCQCMNTITGFKEYKYETYKGKDCSENNTTNKECYKVDC